jgi:hypothetical protein
LSCLSVTASRDSIRRLRRLEPPRHYIWFPNNPTWFQNPAAPMPVVTHRYDLGAMHIHADEGVIVTPRGTYATPHYRNRRMHTRRHELPLRLFRTYAFERIYHVAHVDEWLCINIEGVDGDISLRREEPAALPPDECSICLDSGAGWTRTPCCHRFHGACLGRWRAGTCPLCRGRLQAL